MERSKTLVKNMEINQRNFRKEHLAIRNAMLPGEVAEKSSAIVKRLLQSEWYKDTKEIFAYYPLGNEVDCHALFLQAWADGKRIALPRTKEENQMDFFYIDSLKQLEEGYYDRFFAKYPRLRRYAVCYEHQLEETLPTDQHDIYMHDIYTEREVIQCFWGSEALLES